MKEFLCVFMIFIFIFLSGCVASNDDVAYRPCSLGYPPDNNSPLYDPRYQSCCSGVVYNNSDVQWCGSNICYNPKTHKCIQYGESQFKLCLENMSVCGASCFDPSKEKCIDNVYLCNISEECCKQTLTAPKSQGSFSQTTCKCYDPKIYTCRDGELYKGNSVLCTFGFLCAEGEKCCHYLPDPVPFGATGCYNPQTENCSYRVVSRP